MYDSILKLHMLVLLFLLLTESRESDYADEKASSIWSGGCCRRGSCWPQHTQRRFCSACWWRPQLGCKLKGRSEGKVFWHTDCSYLCTVRASCSPAGWAAAAGEVQRRRSTNVATRKWIGSNQIHQQDPLQPMSTCTANTLGVMILCLCCPTISVCRIISQYQTFHLLLLIDWWCSPLSLSCYFGHFKACCRVAHFCAFPIPRKTVRKDCG